MLPRKRPGGTYAIRSRQQTPVQWKSKYTICGEGIVGCVEALSGPCAQERRRIAIHDLVEHWRARLLISRVSSDGTGLERKCLMIPFFIEQGCFLMEKRVSVCGIRTY